MNKPVIVAVGYNRVYQLNRLLNALEKAEYDCNDVQLIISIDGGGAKEVVELANDFCWSHGEKKVRVFEENKGLRRHVFSCIDYSIEFGSAIIFEDDVLPSPFFYDYVVKALEFYENDNRIFAISLYSQEWNGYANRRFIPIHDGKDAYISQIECSWGECFIGERWKEFKEWYAKNEDSLEYSYDVPHAVYGWKESYSKYILYYVVRNKKYYVTPYEALSTNCHESGTHVKASSVAYQVPLVIGQRKYIFPKFEEAVKYDAFFESIDLREYLESEYEGKVAIDYFGLRRNLSEYDYVLSTDVHPYRIVKGYALSFKPYEINCFRDNEGNGIFLYDTHSAVRRRKNRAQHYRKIKYDVYDLNRIDALFYAIWEYIHKKNE